MMRRSLLLYLFLAAAATGIVVSHDCAFIPETTDASNDTSVMKVDCYRTQRHDAAIDNTTGDTTSLIVYLFNCNTVPVGLFVNASTKLSMVAVLSTESEVLLEGTFEGLEHIAELHLEGFRSLYSLSSAVFHPLRKLERLILVGFGAHRLTYAELGAALRGLSGTPLTRIVMHEIHSIVNEKMVDVTELFQMRNVSVREVSFSNNVVTRISGRISGIFPELQYLCVGLNARYYTAANALFDVWLLLPSIRETRAYAYPVPDTYNIAPDGDSNVLHTLDTAIKLHLLPYLTTDSCLWMLRLPFSPSLRRVTMRNLQMLGVDADKPICFDRSNNLEYIDFAGSPHPAVLPPITGLDKLKYLDIQNTGIVKLPDDFFRYFPSLKVINLVQLSIGESMKHINSSFFGNCPTLTEIHLGDCQITAIPIAAFVHVPALETLNLSSNSLRAFDVDLSNNRNLSYLNFSGNAISTLTESVLAELNAIAQERLQGGEMLIVDLRRNPITCLCNSTHLVRQLQDWVKKQEVIVPGLEEHLCLYPNGSRLAISEVDVDELVSQCSVLSKVKNGSDCPCDDHLRQRLEAVRLSLHGYACRTSDSQLVSMAVQPLPSCPDFFKSATFIAPVVVGGVLALTLTLTLIVLYRHRRDERLHRLIHRVSMSRIIRIGIQHVMERNREEVDSFEYEVFLYIHDSDQEVVQGLFYRELCPHRHVLGHDDFRPGLKLETLLENVQTCRWLVPVLSPNFVNDGECCHFIALAQYSRPHAIVPVVWTAFDTDDLTISSLLDTAEPITWPGNQASGVAKTTFWNSLLERTESMKATNYCSRRT